MVNQTIILSFRVYFFSSARLYFFKKLREVMPISNSGYPRNLLWYETRWFTVSELPGRAESDRKRRGLSKVFHAESRAPANNTEPEAEHIQQDTLIESREFNSNQMYVIRRFFSFFFVLAKYMDWHNKNWIDLPTWTEYMHLMTFFNTTEKL